MIKFILTLGFGALLGVGATLHFAQNSSVKEIAETQKQVHSTEATVSSAAAKAAKKSGQVYEVLKSDDSSPPSNKK